MNDQKKANEWWADLHPLNRRAFTQNENPSASEILRFYRANERNNPMRGN